jgi:hypothetical protein
VFGLVGQNLQGQYGSNEIANRIKQDALILAHNGVDPTVAINTAAAKITQQYTNVNESVVNLANHQVPPYFTTAAQRVVDDYWAAQGTEQEAEGHDKIDIVVQPLNSPPNWMMVYKSGFQPPGNASFNLDDLAGANDRNKQDNLDKAFQQSDARRSNTAIASQDPEAPQGSPLSDFAKSAIRKIGKGVANSPETVAPLPGVASDVGSVLSGVGQRLSESHGFARGYNAAPDTPAPIPGAIQDIEKLFGGSK